MQDELEKQEIDSNVLTQALLNNKLSLDKGLFSLSGAAIGLLVFLMAIIPAASTLTLVFYIIAVICFMFSLSLCLYIYKANSNYIIKLSNNSDAQDELLPVLDKVALSAFMAGLVFIVFIGVFSACNNMQTHAQATQIHSQV